MAPSMRRSRRAMRMIRAGTGALPQRRQAMARPSHRVYSVIKREGKDDYWLNLGVAFEHEDKEGFNLLLQAMPFDGKLVLDFIDRGPGIPEDEREKLGQAYERGSGGARADPRHRARARGPRAHAHPRAATPARRIPPDRRPGLRARRR